jgi:hypothetical protein
VNKKKKKQKHETRKLKHVQNKQQRNENIQPSVACGPMKKILRVDKNYLRYRHQNFIKTAPLRAVQAAAAADCLTLSSLLIYAK